MTCPFHGAGHLSSCGYCRRAKRYAFNAKRRQQRHERRASPNRPPPTEAEYVDHPERNTAEDIAAIMRTIVKEFG